MRAAAARPYACRSSGGAAGGGAKSMEATVYTVAAPPTTGRVAEQGNGWRGEGVSTREWQGWGSSSPVPAMVTKAIDDLKALRMETEEQITFGGIGGKLQGSFKAQEDRKQRGVYRSLAESESKFQFYSARQIACRLLGSRGYLCQKCWLAEEDCMCSRLVQSSLWSGIRFWVYMHPKDFLRQNNTGKLLWQVFGTQSASLCLYGIREDEDIMWDEFKLAGKESVWVLYPNRTSSPSFVQDIPLENFLLTSTDRAPNENPQKALNFVLIDGTWSNSTAMFNRLKEQAKAAWGQDELPCLALNDLGVSPMHKLRPQPGWDRTCTAAAAMGLLSELDRRPELAPCRLDGPASALEQALDALLEALVARRKRMGRSVTRRERNPLF
ncbi:DTW domain-containing protein isoform X2 [Wolffia australiana]